jgi:hypothetical protein
MREHVMHQLAIGQRGCPKLTEQQRRCLASTKTYDDTYACIGKIAPQAEQKDFVALLSANPEPLLVRPFDAVPWKPTARVDWIEPAWCVRDAIVMAWCEHKRAEFPGVVFRVFRDFSIEDKNPPIGPFTVTLAGAGVRDKLIAAWGQPGDTGDTAYWFNPRIHLRVGLRAAKLQGDPPDHVDLEFSGYQPLNDLIGGKPGRFGFEQGNDLLGASADDIRKRYAPRVGNGRIKLWPHETATRAVEIVLGSELDSTLPERVEGYQVKLAGADRKLLQRLLDKKLGAPREEAGVLVFRDKPRIALDDTTLLVGEVPAL